MYEREIKGISTELMCQNAFIQLGYNVSVPISPYCVYDFIVDINNKLYKIQVKSCSKSKTGIKLSTMSSYSKASGNVYKFYTKEQIDYICTFYEGQCYLIPIEEIENRNSITLSFEDNWVNAHHLILAENYILEKQLDLILNNKKYFLKKKYKIQQLSKDDELIAEFDTVAECDLCKKNITKQAHISECINGKRETAYGFKWKRIEYY